jgi:hypothetical protein
LIPRIEVGFSSPHHFNQAAPGWRQGWGCLDLNLQKDKRAAALPRVPCGRLSWLSGGNLGLVYIHAIVKFYSRKIGTLHVSSSLLAVFFNSHTTSAESIQMGIPEAGGAILRDAPADKSAGV